MAYPLPSARIFIYCKLKFIKKNKNRIAYNAHAANLLNKNTKLEVHNIQALFVWLALDYPLRKKERKKKTHTHKFTLYYIRLVGKETKTTTNNAIYLFVNDLIIIIHFSLQYVRAIIQ